MQTSQWYLEDGVIYVYDRFFLISKHNHKDFLRIPNMNLHISSKGVVGLTCFNIGFPKIQSPSEDIKLWNLKLTIYNNVSSHGHLF